MAMPPFTSVASGTARSMGLHVRDSVLAAFAPWNIQFEGHKNFLYADKDGWVTTGIGNKVDPIGLALSLPWKINGRPASQGEIAQGWNAVKSAYHQPAPGADFYAGLTNLRLDDEGIRAVVNRMLMANDNALAKAYPDFASWPADAQLALLSMAWAMGTGRIVPGALLQFTTMRNALLRSPPDFRAAAATSHMDDRNNKGLVPRNKANELLFENAARVIENGDDPEVLYYLRGVGGAIVRSGSTRKREIVTIIAVAAGAAALLAYGSGKR